jgi:3-hydroxyisobutyrate dehydrogenase-like beta-hydroxyacid dehydrogenase
MNVGFIGLGRMGVGMATNLSKAGHRLTAHNRTQANAEKP